MYGFVWSRVLRAIDIDITQKYTGITPSPNNAGISQINNGSVVLKCSFSFLLPSLN